MPGDDPTKCPICDNELERGPNRLGDAFELSCPICGQFQVTGSLAHAPPFRLHPELCPYLSAHIRHSNQKNVVPQLDSKNWERFARSRARTPIFSKLAMVLEELARRAPVPGDTTSIDGNRDYPLFDARGSDEVEFLLKAADERGWIEAKARTMGGLWGHLALTVEGWTQLESFSSENRASNTCFVAMSFDSSLISLYEEAIQPAIEACGFLPDRVDRREFNNKICDEIIAGIRKSCFMVADFTGHRGGVYFEAGFAHGLGRPVIFTCRDTDIGNAHFDTDHYNHIVWNDPEHLRRKLVDRIEATIDR